MKKVFVALSSLMLFATSHGMDPSPHRNTLEWIRNNMIQCPIRPIPMRRDCFQPRFLINKHLLTECFTRAPRPMLDGRPHRWLRPRPANERAASAREHSFLASMRKPLHPGDLAWNRVKFQITRPRSPVRSLWLPTPPIIACPISLGTIEFGHFSLQIPRPKSPGLPSIAARFKIWSKRLLWRAGASLSPLTAEEL
jgi:hypothetical protein